MILKPIKTKKISEEIIEQIKNLFLSGGLKAGDRLPSERDLSDTLGVSRSAVREALSALDLMGLIEIKPGSGTYVRQSSSAEIYTPLSMMLMVEQTTVKEIFEMRKIIEVAAASMAARQRREEDLQRMEKALQMMEGDIQKGNLAGKADFVFHNTVLSAAGNGLMVRLMGTLSDHMRQTAQGARKKFYALPGVPQRLMEEHWTIYEAIREQDPQKAADGMMDHLVRAEQAILQQLDGDK